MASALEGPIELLVELGVVDVLLPFALIFTIIYAVLQKTKMIGEGRKNFNISIALIIALLVVIPHVMDTYPPGRDVVEIINQALPQVSLVVVAILMVMLLIGIFAPGIAFQTTGIGTLLALFSILAVAFIFGNALGWWGSFEDNSVFSFLNDPDTQAVLIIILVFGLIVWFITRDDSNHNARASALENLQGFLFGRGGGGGHP